MALVVLRNLNDTSRNGIQQIDEWYLPADAVKTTLKDPVGRPYYVWSNNTTAAANTANTAQTVTVAKNQIAAEVTRLSGPSAVGADFFGIFLK
jgi:hypothetical protein